MYYRKKFLNAIRRIAKQTKQMNKEFWHPRVRGKDKSLSGEAVLVGTPENQQNHKTAEADRQLIENIDSVARYLRKESKRNAVSEEQRREVVEKYRKEKGRGRVGTKQAWALNHAGIDVRTLSNWEKEFPE